MASSSWSSEIGALLFEHTLELLLYEVLEDRIARESSDDTLAKTIEFLKVFPSFPEIVTRCARKVDASAWETLFRPIGPPKMLIEVASSD